MILYQTDGAGIYIGHDAEGLAELRQRSIRGRWLKGRKGKDRLDDGWSHRAAGSLAELKGQSELQRGQ